ncbi:hypothetical protein JYB64_14935 [Algoriphagus aestuarii]|nr:hypothetical protein [Algoriphagus aestuarii]
MNKFLLLALFSLLFACSQKNGKSQIEPHIPELVITDSLVIDHLTMLGMLDVKDDHSEFLFHDFKTNELLRVNNSGEILVKVNRSEDGKDSYKQQYFVSANYFGQDRILVFTFTSAIIYDLEFNLIEEKKLDFELVTRRIGGSRVVLPLREYLYTFSLDNSDVKEVKESENFSVAYPFMTIRDRKTLDILHSVAIPSQSQMALNPGFYKNLEPIVKLVGEDLHVLFPHSPEMYIYSIPDMTLKKSFSLDPGDDYKQISPSKEDQSFQGFIDALGSSDYSNFVYTNGYLLTQFTGFVPQDLVDDLPKDFVGGPEYVELSNKYKTKYNYQIFKDEMKIWQGNLDVNLWSVGDLLFSTTKPGEEPDAVEKDMQTFYFYELR